MTETAKVRPDTARAAALVREMLLPGLRLECPDPTQPIVPAAVPSAWTLLGCGNFAGVFVHPEAADIAVKVYAPGRPGWEDELEVYRRLGVHPAYSYCHHAEDSGGYRWLLLTRLQGVTMFQCLLKGLPIPPSAIADIDAALAYARSVGLRPSDVHAKNVMIAGARGLVVDVSDFLEQEDCAMWDALKKAYGLLYVPLLAEAPRPLPAWTLEGVRRGYRLFRELSE